MHYDFQAPAPSGAAVKANIERREGIGRARESKMQRVGEVEAGLVGVESSCHADRLLGCQSRQAEQGAEEALEIGGRTNTSRATKAHPPSRGTLPRPIRH